MQFLGDDRQILAEFERAVVWERYKTSLVEEVLEKKREKTNGTRRRTSEDARRATDVGRRATRDDSRKTSGALFART
jgi:hypothetical protein